MNYEISNEYLTLTVKTAGAEMISVKSKEGLEYMWCGDKKYWGRHAPVLFPIVGKVLDNEYTVEGNTYSLTQHGFARDSEFKLIHQNHQALTFALESCAATKEKYPFDFELRITYTLEGRTVAIKYEVFNKDCKELPFSIGAHPAFNCPMLEGETLEDYYIEFECEEDATKLLTTPEVYLTGETERFHAKEIPLSFDFFKNDATILTDTKSRFMALRCKKNNHSVVVSSKAFPFTGIWSPVTGAPFVCIEPWIGHTDYLSDSKEFAKKKDMQILKKGQNFSAQFEVTFN